MLPIAALSLGLFAQPIPDAQTHYQRELGPQANVEVIHTISGGGPTHIFFTVIRRSSDTAQGFPTIRWFALRDERRDGSIHRMWASAEDCPALYSLVDWAEGVTIPEIRTLLRQPPEPRYNLGDEPWPRRAMDAPSHTIEGRGRSPDFDFPWVTITSNGGYVAQWGEAVREHLEPCWREERPEF